MKRSLILPALTLVLGLQLSLSAQADCGVFYRNATYKTNMGTGLIAWGAATAGMAGTIAVGLGPIGAIPVVGALVLNGRKEKRLQQFERIIYFADIESSYESDLSRKIINRVEKKLDRTVTNDEFQNAVRRANQVEAFCPLEGEKRKLISSTKKFAETVATFL